MITIEASRLAGYRGEYDVVEVAHLDCAGCAEQALLAASTASVTGSVGATSSIGGDVLPEAAHGARVVRARCASPRRARKGGSCCCPICNAVRRVQETQAALAEARGQEKRVRWDVLEPAQAEYREALRITADADEERLEAQRALRRIRSGEID